jgi:hypothetical protein
VKDTAAFFVARLTTSPRDELSVNGTLVTARQRERYQDQSGHLVFCKQLLDAYVSPYEAKDNDDGAHGGDSPGREECRLVLSERPGRWRRRVQPHGGMSFAHLERFRDSSMVSMEKLPGRDVALTRSHSPGLVAHPGLDSWEFLPTPSGIDCHGPNSYSLTLKIVQTRETGAGTGDKFLHSGMAGRLIGGRGAHLKPKTACRKADRQHWLGP